MAKKLTAAQQQIIDRMRGENLIIIPTLDFYTRTVKRYRLEYAHNRHAAGRIIPTTAKAIIASGAVEYRTELNGLKYNHYATMPVEAPEYAAAQADGKHTGERTMSEHTNTSNLFAADELAPLATDAPAPAVDAATGVSRKTAEEIEALKVNWRGDPCWDIEDTEGFEAHYDELKAYHDEMRAKWDAAVLEHYRGIIHTLLKVKVDELSPMEAMTKLYELQRMARSTAAATTLGGDQLPAVGAVMVTRRRRVEDIGGEQKWNQI